ncbi:hypothetical protein [Streptomyces sp. NPDC002225]|uniref:hypothetical protein n=1 Tax=Streptomyces sp. NPDC002225 TaxID=3154413 RepID=UPI003326724F
MTTDVSKKVRRRKGVLRGLFSLAGAFMLTLFAATSASAHYVYGRDEAWSNAAGSNCLYVYGEVSHGNRGGYAKSYALASDDWGVVPSCIWVWERPAGYLATKYSYYKKTSSGWKLCRSIGWKYNTTKTSRVTATKNYGVAPPCGGGYYATRGWAMVYYNGAWVGKSHSVWSGSHYIEP